MTGPLLPDLPEFAAFHTIAFHLLTVSIAYVPAGIFHQKTLKQVGLKMSLPLWVPRGSGTLSLTAQSVLALGKERKTALKHEDQTKEGFSSKHTEPSLPLSVWLWAGHLHFCLLICEMGCAYRLSPTR